MQKLKLGILTGTCLCIVALAGCANHTLTPADQMRGSAANSQADADDIRQLSRDWDRGTKLVEDGQKRLEDGRKRVESARADTARGQADIDQGNREIAEGQALINNSERLFNENTPPVLVAP